MKCGCKCDCMNNQSIRRLKSQLAVIERVPKIHQVKVKTPYPEEYQRVDDMWKEWDKTLKESK